MKPSASVIGTSNISNPLFANSDNNEAIKTTYPVAGIAAIKSAILNNRKKCGED